MRRHPVAVCLVGLLLVSGVVKADEIVRDGTEATLDQGTAWDGDIAPTSDDVAVWQTGASSPHETLGADLSWQGIKIIDPSVAFDIIGANTLTLGSSGIDMSAATIDLTINNGGGLIVGAAQTWNVASGRTLWVRNNITGAGHLTLTGSGTTYLSGGSNLYSGGTTLNGANVLIGSIVEFGTGTMTIQNDVNLARDTAGTMTVGVPVAFTGAANSLTLGSSAAPTRFSLSAGADAGTEVRTINLVNADAPSTGNIALSIGGTTTIGSGGALVLNNGNTNPSTQEVWVKFGISSNVGVVNGNLEIGQNVQVYLNSSFQLGAGTELTVNGILDVSNKVGSAINPTIKSLAGAGRILSDKNIATVNTLTIDGGASTTSTIFSGSITNGLAPLAITKTGATTQILTGINTYTGLTTVNAGTLLINGDQSSATGNVTVALGATLGGTGTIGGTTTVNGTLAAGTSPGTLTFSQGLNINNGATYAFEGGDLVIVNGQLDLNDNWTLALGSRFTDGGSTVIFSYGSLAGSPDLTPTFDISGLGFIPSGPLSLFDDTINNQIVLLGVSAIPEPGTSLLVGFGLVGILYGFRRRA